MLRCTVYLKRIPVFILNKQNRIIYELWVKGISILIYFIRSWYIKVYQTYLIDKPIIDINHQEISISDRNR